MEYRNGFKKVGLVNKLGRTFVILKDEKNMYWGIEDKYIIDGRIVKPHNGISGLMTDNMKHTIDLAFMVIETDKLVAEGMSRMEAVIFLTKRNMGVKDGVEG